MYNILENKQTKHVGPGIVSFCLGAELSYDFAQQEYPSVGQDCCYIKVMRNIKMFFKDDDDDVVTRLCLQIVKEPIGTVVNFL